MFTYAAIAWAMLLMLTAAVAGSFEMVDAARRALEAGCGVLVVAIAGKCCGSAAMAVVRRSRRPLDGTGTNTATLR